MFVIYNIFAFIFLGSIILAYIVLHISCVQYGPTCGFFCVSYVLWRRNHKVNRYKTAYRLIKESDTKVGEVFDVRKIRKMLQDNHVRSTLVRVYTERDLKPYLNDSLLIVPVKKGNDPHYVIVEGSTREGYCFVRDTALSVPILRRIKEVEQKHDDMKGYLQYDWDSFFEREKRRFKGNIFGKWIHNLFCAIFFGKLYFLEKKLLKDEKNGAESISMYPEAVAIKLTELK